MLAVILIQCMLSFTDNPCAAFLLFGPTERVHRQRQRFEHLDQSFAGRQLSDVGGHVRSKQFNATE